MEALYFLIGITAAMLIGVYISYMLGWLLTDVIKLPLKVKPFNCRPCLTFWITSLFGIAFSYYAVPMIFNQGLISNVLTGHFGIIGVGFLLGFINYFLVKSKIKIYE